MVLKNKLFKTITVVISTHQMPLLLLNDITWYIL